MLVKSRENKGFSVECPLARILRRGAAGVRNGVDVAGHLFSTEDYTGGPVFWNVLCWVGSVEDVDPAVGIAMLLACRKAGTVHVVLGLDSPHRYRRDLPPPKGRVEPLTPQLIDRMSKTAGNESFLDSMNE